VLLLAFILDIVACCLNLYAGFKTQKTPYFIWAAIFFALAMFCINALILGDA